MGAKSCGPSRFHIAPALHITKKIVREKIFAAWEASWTKAPHYRQTKIWFPSIVMKKSNFLMRFNRFELGTIIQLITGFNNLGYHTNNKKQCPEALCRLCGSAPEETFHLVSTCPALYVFQYDLFGFGGLHTYDALELIPKFLAHPRVHYLYHNRPG